MLETSKMRESSCHPGKKLLKKAESKKDAYKPKKERGSGSKKKATKAKKAKKSQRAPLSPPKKEKRLPDCWYWRFCMRVISF